MKITFLSKNDPAYTSLRKLFIVKLWVEIAPQKRGCRETVDRGNAIVSLDNAKISELTEHLLAVRDRRDKDAFAALFDHFAPRLKGFFMRSGCSAAFAEEIAQNAMLTLWRKSAQFDPHRHGTRNSHFCRHGF